MTFITKLTKNQGSPTRDPWFFRDRSRNAFDVRSEGSIRSRTSTIAESIRSFRSSASSATAITIPSLASTPIKHRSRAESIGSVQISSEPAAIMRTVKPKAPWRMEENRRYHDIPGSNYPLPSDDEEMDRIQIQHYLLRFAFEDNMTAPVQPLLMKGANVLDIGCAAGTWMLELATEYPNSEFWGVDIQSVFPEIVKPPNCNFRLCNVLDGLPWADGTFDFVHMRFMSYAFSKQQWDQVVKEMVRVTKPGGYIELFEGENSPRRLGPQSAIVLKQINFAIQARNIDIHCPSRLGKILESAGVVNVNCDFSSMPIAWGGRPGECQKENFQGLMKSMKPWLARSLACPNDKYDELSTTILEECAQKKSFINYHFAYGRVPLQRQKRENPEKMSFSL